MGRRDRNSMVVGFARHHATNVFNTKVTISLKLVIFHKPHI